MKTIFKKTVVSLLTLEAKAVLRKYKPKIVAVTGTVGKTSAKDAIYTALSRTLNVRKTKKNQNSEFGLPLTILGEENPVETRSPLAWLKVLAHGLDLILMPHHYPEWLVLEVGADHPGDIQMAMAWVHPDVSVVTKLARVPVHVEFFPSVKEVIWEKSFLIRALSEKGTAVLNADDEDVRAFKELTGAPAIFFGSAPDADVSAENYEVALDDRGMPTGIRFEVLHRPTGERFQVLLRGTLGSHLMYPILAALAVTEAVGENVASAAKAFRTHEPSPGRMRLIEGVGGSLIIDDTYNSSPVALEEALKTLGDLSDHRRIAVLGDMLELGKYSIDEHKKAGILACENADVLITIGQRMIYAAESARETGMQDVRECADSHEAAEYLTSIVRKGDIVLVKGSQGVRAERVVLALMEHPEDAEKLLVRQDAEWRVRDKRRG
jgi:UDP-N-acetylmuramoyl-tripeptide--D-alanyl-D-alanine ligase